MVLVWVRFNVMLVVKNSFCEMSIKVCGLNNLSVKGVEKEMIMLMFVVSVMVMV